MPSESVTFFSYPHLRIPVICDYRGSSQEEITRLYEGPPPGNSFVFSSGLRDINEGFKKKKNSIVNFVIKNLGLDPDSAKYLDPDSMNPAAKHCLHAR